MAEDIYFMVVLICLAIGVLALLAVVLCWLDIRVDLAIYRINKRRADDAAKLADRLAGITRDIDRQLNCIADGGHDYRYAWQGYFDMNPGYAEFAYKYLYKCTVCGHERHYSWDELTAKDQKALTRLGMGE